MLIPIGLNLLKLRPTGVSRFFASSAIALAKERTAKQASKKALQPREVVLSWQISKNDLESQKRKAIESILAKGSRLQVKLELRNKKGYHPPTDNELEARQILLDRVNTMVGAAGGVNAKPPQGSIRTRMMLYFSPKQGGA